MPHPPPTTKPTQVLPIPYTVVLLIMGLIIGVILTYGAGVHVNSHGRAEGENIFVNSISQVFFFIMIAPPLFSSSDPQHTLFSPR